MDIRSFFKAKDHKSNSEALEDRIREEATASPAPGHNNNNTLTRSSPEASGGHVRSDDDPGPPGEGINMAGDPPHTTDLGEKDSGPSQPIKWDYATTVVKMVLYLGKQGLVALQGHDESRSSTNSGNVLLLELCALVSTLDDAFCAAFNSSPFDLTSHDAQNQLLEIAIKSVKSQIIRSVEENGFYTILVDEARSCKQQEQMTVCVRYAEGLEPKERFLGFVNSSEEEVQDANAIYGHVKHLLEECGLYGVPIVAQSYDGTAVMSGHVNGVQTRLREDHPSAAYIHCMDHDLVLVLVDACKVNRTAMGFFHTLESLYAFFARPGTDHAYTQAQKELGVTADLTALSDTRWACRWKNVSAVKDGLQALTATLSDLSEPPYRWFVEASGLLETVTRADFCVSLVVFNDLLRAVHVAHTALRGKDATLSKAASVLESMMNGFENMRTDSQKWDGIWSEIQTFCQSVDVCLESGDDEGPPRKRPGASTATTMKQKWASQLFYPVLDTLLAECRARFSAQSLTIAESVDAVFKCDSGGAESLISRYANILNINPQLTLTEMRMVSTQIQNGSTENIRRELVSGHYPNYEKLFRLALSLPVGTATCERSFSARRRIRHWQRTTMGQERLTPLSLLYIEGDLTDKLKAEELIAAYDAKTKRRILLH